MNRVVMCRALVTTVLLVGWSGQGPQAAQFLQRFPVALCTIDSSGIEFGIYDTRSPTPLDATGRVSFSCSTSVVVTILFTPGHSGSFDRTMTGGADKLAYNLYLDSSHTQIFGDGKFGTSIYLNTNPPKDASIGVPVYGQIPALQNVGEGRYTDSLEVVVIF